MASICSSPYLLLNHWMKTTKFGVQVAHMNGARNDTFLDPAPWGPVEGPKGQMSLNFNYKVIFKYFETKLCVFSRMKD